MIPKQASFGTLPTTHTRKPISRTNHKINMIIQNDISSGWSHENHTGIFWNLEDCPVPGGLRPEIFIYCLAETLSTGFKSVMAYGKKRSLAFYDHLLYGFFPVTLVPTGDKDERIKKMFKDIFLWALDRPRTSKINRSGDHGKLPRQHV